MVYRSWLMDWPDEFTYFGFRILGFQLGSEGLTKEKGRAKS